MAVPEAILGNYSGTAALEATDNNEYDPSKPALKMRAPR